MLEFDDNALLLLSAECYTCDPYYNLRADMHSDLASLVNTLHDMMEKKIENNYPMRLLLIDVYDGEIKKDLELNFDAGCLSGLKEISFKLNNLTYRIKRGKRNNGTES